MGFLIQFENVFICLTEIFFCKVENVPNFFIFFSFLLIIFLRVEVLFASRCCLLNFFLYNFPSLFRLRLRCLYYFSTQKELSKNEKSPHFFLIKFETLLILSL